MSSVKFEKVANRQSGGPTLQTYSSRFNRRHKFFGHFFSGRHNSPFIDGSGTGCPAHRFRIRAFNPICARLVKEDQPLRPYRWSSYPPYRKARRPSWLRVDRVLGECGIPGDTPAGRTRFEQVMEARRFKADGRRYQALPADESPPAAKSRA